MPQSEKKTYNEQEHLQANKIYTTFVYAPDDGIPAPRSAVFMNYNTKLNCRKEEGHSYTIRLISLPCFSMNNMTAYRTISLPMLVAALAWFATTCLVPVARADDRQGKLLYQIDIHEEIGSTTWRYLLAGMEEARSQNADVILLDLNTYGGTVLHADSMRTAILNADRPVYAFVSNNAASAGALIALACDSIYMRPGARIGAATVVNETGAAMPDKYQSYMRATMRATAEAHGKKSIVTAAGDTVTTWRRDPAIAEAMVDERVVIPNLTDSGEVLTFTAQEAINHGYCEAIATDADGIARERLHYDNYRIEQYTPSLYDKIAGFLTNPALQALMITFIIGGIFFELKAPGIGLPTAVALIAAVLYFLPLYLSGTAENWEILLFVAGVILLILEIFVIPGFGITGITGGVLILASFILALVSNVVFDFTFVSEQAISRSILTVMAGIVIAVLLLLFLSQRIGRKGLFYNLALHAEQAGDKGYIGVDETPRTLVGQKGVTVTRMAPSGKIKVDGEIYDAISLYGSFIEAGSEITIEKYENSQLYVVISQQNISDTES